jgi:hypothetical protein
VVARAGARDRVVVVPVGEHAEAHNRQEGEVTVQAEACDGRRVVVPVVGSSRSL